MAKVILEFDVYEDSDLIKIHNKATSMAAAIDDMSSWLRQLYKYEDRKEIDLEEVRQAWFSILEDRSVGDN